MAPLARFLWSGTGVRPRLARLVLLPQAALYGAAMLARTSWYNRRLLPIHRLPGPVVSVGNLSVGGTGKTPLASWVARFFLSRGRRPGILLRGYGNDEDRVHRRRLPDAITVAHPDRVQGAQLAARQGADAFVMDDGFQRRDVHRDLDIVLVSVESAAAAPWLLPAGPWREPWGALRRAGIIVVTAKAATEPEVRGMVGRIHRVAPGVPVAVARMTPTRLTGLRSGRAVSPGSLRGLRVLASAGIADPDSLAAQLAGLGANVRRLDWEDHRQYCPRDITTILRIAREADETIVTEKDAVKLATLWPAEHREPLVLGQSVRWEMGARLVMDALDQVLARRADASPASSPSGPPATASAV